MLLIFNIYCSLLRIRKKPSFLNNCFNAFNNSGNLTEPPQNSPTVKFFIMKGRPPLWSESSCVEIIQSIRLTLSAPRAGAITR